MSRPTIVKALVWKELRQIAPLFWAVLGLGGGLNLLLITLFLLTSPGGSGVISPYSFIVMPIIFATGVGVLLVSVEKENRTLQWLQGMPVSSAQIAKTKFLVALVSLAAVWALSLLMFWLFRVVFQGQTGITKPELDSLSESYFYPILFPTVSFFLGFAGLALAWQVSKPIYALLLLIPVTVVVWITSEFSKVLLRPQFGATPDSSSVDWGIGVASWAIGLVGAAVYGWLASQRDLAARTASTPWLSLLGESTKSTVAPPQWWRWESVPQNSALLWQSARQNWLPWSMLTIVFFVGIWMCGAFPQIGGYNDDLSVRVLDRDPPALLVLFLGTVTVCWLGCLAFQGDNIANRIRFFADRGVSPTRVWISRHWIPILILLLATFWRLFTRRSFAQWEGADPQVILADSICFFLAALGIYSVSQWWSQCIRSPLLSVITSPLIAGVFIAYGLFALLMFEAPIWLLGISLIIGGIATWSQMKDWMDRSFDRRFFGGHAAWLLTAMVIPLMPGIWAMLTAKPIDPEIRTALERTWKEGNISDDTMLGFRMHLLQRNFSESQTVDKVQKRFESNEDVRAEYLRYLQSDEERTVLQGLRSSDFVRFCLAELSSSQSVVVADASDEHVATYRSIANSIFESIRLIRSTGSLLAQDNSEILEMALLRECKATNARESLGEDLYRKIAVFLADSDSRDKARKLKLSRAWKMQSQYERSNWFSDWGYDFGAYTMPYKTTNPSLPGMLRRSRERDALAANLWNLLNAQSRDESAALRKEIDPDDQIKQFSDWVAGTSYVNALDILHSYPGSHWRGDWESETKALMLTLDSEPAKSENGGGR
jgi:hypothetical protein